MTNSEIKALQKLDREARRVADGHFTVMRFTTGWKAALGTATICQAGSYNDPETCRCPHAHDLSVPSFPTLVQAVEWALTEGREWGSSPHPYVWREVFVVWEEFAAMCGMSVNQARAHIDALSEYGHLRVVEDYGDGTALIHMYADLQDSRHTVIGTLRDTPAAPKD